MGWTAGPNDLTLGDPLGVHIRLLGDEARIVLVNAAGVEIMVLDGTELIFGQPFATNRIWDNDGVLRADMNALHYAILGDDGTAKIKAGSGGFPPALELHPAGSDDTGSVVGTPDVLTLLAPTSAGRTAAEVTLESATASADALATVRADLDVLGFVKAAGDILSGATAALFIDAGPAAGNTTAATAFADLPAGAGVSYVDCEKRYASTLTNLRVRLDITVKASAVCSARFGVNVGTVVGGVATPAGDFSLGRRQIDVANVAGQYSIERDLTGINPGTRRLQIRWRIGSAAGPVLTFGSDYSASLTVSEVPA